MLDQQVRGRSIMAIFALLLLALWIAAPIQAQEQPKIKVGVLIQHNGKAQTFCVELPQDRRTGLDALEATGIDLASQRGPLGASVCRMDKLGCTPPSEDCFCQCQAGSCNYWSYFFQQDGKWIYSQLGPLNRTLTQGAVDGWLWNEGAKFNSGNVTPVGALPLLTFEQICAADQQVAPAESSATGVDYAPFGYLAFALAGITIIGVTAWRRVRSRSA